MEEYMRESMRKLALWDTKTFRPLITHEDLDLIMSTLGFISLPPKSSGWKEYVFLSSSSSSSSSSPPPPTPRLPYPYIDGLHIYTYTAFLDAVRFYLRLRDIADIFHVRGMPLHRGSDKNRKWRRMEEGETVFVYREGTLEQATYNLYHLNKHSSSNNKGCDTSILLRNRENNDIPVNCIFVPLKDIIV